jgi:ABC transporter ATM
MDKRLLLRELKHYLWPPGEPSIRRRVVASVALMTAGKALSVSVPFFFKHAVDTLSMDPASAATTAATVSSFLEHPVAPYFVGPSLALAGYGIVRAASSLCSELRSAVFAKVAQRSVRLVDLRTFEHLHKLDLRFHVSRQAGALGRIIDKGSQGIGFLLSSVVFHVVPTVLELGLVAALLGTRLSPSFATCALLTVGMYAGFTFAITRWRTEIRKRMNAAENAAAARALDSLVNYETVKYLGGEKREATLYNNLLTTYEGLAVKTQRSLAVLNFGQQAIFSTAVAGMMVATANGVSQGIFTVGDVVLVHGLLFQLAMPLNFLGTVYREIRQAVVDVNQLYSLVSTPPTTTSKPGATPIDRAFAAQAEIKFNNVSFSYDKRTILDGMNLTLPAGSSVGVVGPSGSGKSTLTRLLFRFYDPTQGSVSLGGHDLRDLDLDSLRATIGVVPQDVSLFNDTLEANLRYGRPDATAADVARVLRLAQLEELVSRLPDGLQTVVGERGLKLSGGEKQRVALARMLLRDPPIVILDEATSALDSATERAVTAALRQVAQGEGRNQRTMVVIAHRLSTVVLCDKIIVVDQGRVVEEGTHAALLELGGLYADLWTKQQQHKRV